MLYSEHSLAFKAWHVSRLDHTSLLWKEPPPGADSVEPVLCKFGDYLKVRVERDAVSVVAEWDYDQWDVLFTAQARVMRQPPFFACEHEPDVWVAPIESLWDNWLYDPLLTWAEEVLMPARSLCFCRRGDTRWARLGRDVTAVPADAAFAVFG